MNIYLIYFRQYFDFDTTWCTWWLRQIYKIKKESKSHLKLSSNKLVTEKAAKRETFKDNSSISKLTFYPAQRGDVLSPKGGLPLEPGQVFALNGSHSNLDLGVSRVAR